MALEGAGGRLPAAGPRGPGPGLPGPGPPGAGPPPGRAQQAVGKRHEALSVLPPPARPSPPLIGAAVDVVVRQKQSWVARWGVTEPADQILALALARPEPGQAFAIT